MVFVGIFWNLTIYLFFIFICQVFFIISGICFLRICLFPTLAMARKSSTGTLFSLFSNVSSLNSNLSLKPWQLWKKQPHERRQKNGEMQSKNGEKTNEWGEERRLERRKKAPKIVTPTLGYPKINLKFRVLLTFVCYFLKRQLLEFQIFSILCMV